MGHLVLTLNLFCRISLLCEEEGRDLGELSDGGRVCVGDHVAEVVERVVQVVHPPTLPGVDAGAERAVSWARSTFEEFRQIR